jgi:ActR/RegA family two-component response regulator
MGAAPRILILDDEVPLVDALARHFRRRGYDPTHTYPVADAAQAARAH